MVRRLLAFLATWVLIWLWLLNNYYVTIIPFNNPATLTGNGLEKDVKDLRETEILPELIDFFDDRIGAEQFNYDIIGYNDFQLSIEATNPRLSYIHSIMTLNLNGETKEIPYRLITPLWKNLRKDEIFTAFESINFRATTSSQKDIIIAPNSTLTVSTVGYGWIAQQLDKKSKWLLFMYIPFVLIGLLGLLQFLFKFLKRGFQLE